MLLMIASFPILEFAMTITARALSFNYLKQELTLIWVRQHLGLLASVATV